MRRLGSLVTAVVLHVFFGGVALTQRTRVLSQPDAEFPEPLSSVTAVRELKDGTVIVLDATERLVKRVRFQLRQSLQVGRQGSGPGEYLRPVQVFVLAADSTAFLDVGNGRVLTFDSDLKAGHSLDMFSGAGLSNPTRVEPDAGPSPPPLTRIAFLDSLGRAYSEALPVIRAEDGTFVRASDSAAIERWARGGRKRDTLAFVRVREDRKGLVRNSHGQIAMLAPRSTKAFETWEQWVVAPDGRIAIARLQPYSVDFVSTDGVRRNGPALPFERLRVTAQDRQQWVVQRQDSRLRSAASTTRPGESGIEWPEFLPPFLDGALFFAPDGQLWVQRAVTAGKPPTFDVINREGKVGSRVVFRPNVRLAGFGKRWLFAVRTDSDGLQYLQRYRYEWSVR
jgi:hypothetical protein